MRDYYGLRERIVAGLQSLQGIPHVPDDYNAFRIGLYRAQIEAFEALPAPTGTPKFPLGPGSLTFDSAILSRLLIQTCQSFLLDSPARVELEKLAAQQELLPEAVRAAVFGPDMQALQKLSNEAGAPVDALLFFGRAGGVPFVSKVIWPASDSSIDIAPGTSPCPWCGSAPGLSFLRGEVGKRFLVCSLCGMEWEFPRTRCPFCSAESSVEIISESEAAPSWVETCGSCRRYLKAADERKLGKNEEFSPLLEAVATLYLDFIAEQEGCLRALPYVAMR